MFHRCVYKFHDLGRGYDRIDGTLSAPIPRRECLKKWPQLEVGWGHLLGDG